MNKKGEAYSRLFRWLGYWAIVAIIGFILLRLGVDLPGSYEKHWFNNLYIGILWIFLAIILIDIYRKKKKGILEKERNKIERDPVFGYPISLWRIDISSAIFTKLLFLLFGLYIIIFVPVFWYWGLGMILASVIWIIVGAKVWKHWL